MSRNESFPQRVVRRIVEDKTIKLFKDAHGDPYIAPNGDGTQVYPISSGSFNDWLYPYVMSEFDSLVLIGDQAKNITDTLCGYAKWRGDGTYNLSLRNHRDEYENVWYDLGREAVKITPNGWSVEAYPPIMFMRFSDCQSSQVMPKRGGNIFDLFDFINVKDERDRLLIIAFAVVSLIPEVNKPILSLSGQAGSGKTEASRTLKALLDPTIPLVASLSDKTDELDRMAQTNSVMAFDNLSSLTKRMSDHWCKLATGLGVRIKKYYITSEYITFEAIRPIIANGISQTLIESDVLNRAIPVELTPLEKRIDDQEFRRRFEKAKPYLLGSLFDVLSSAMRIFPNVPERKWPRMASFAKWGWAITESLEGYSGDDFLSALDKIAKTQHDEAIEANPIAYAIMLYMSDKDEWRGTSSELLRELEEPARTASSESSVDKYRQEVSKHIYGPYWPKDARGTSVALRRVIPDLKSVGIEVELDIRENNRRIIHIVNPKVKEKIEGERRKEEAERLEREAEALKEAEMKAEAKRVEIERLDNELKEQERLEREQFKPYAGLYIYFIDDGSVYYVTEDGELHYQPDLSDEIDLDQVPF